MITGLPWQGMKPGSAQKFPVDPVSNGTRRWGRSRFGARGRGADWPGLLLLLLLALGRPGLSGAGEHDLEHNKALQKRRAQFEQIQQERERVQRRVTRFEKSEQKILEDIEQLSTQIRLAYRQRRELETRITALLALRKEQQKDIEGLKTRVLGNHDRMRERFRRLFALHKSRRSASILNTGKLNDFHKHSQLLALLKTQDLQAVKQFEAQIQALNSRQKEAHITLQELDGLKVELQRERELLREKDSYLRSALEHMKKNRDLYAAYLNQTEETAQGVEQALKVLESAPVPPPTSVMPVNPLGAKGQLSRPTEGDIIAAYGKTDPRYNMKKFQRGILLKVSADAKIKSVLAGKVVHGGPFRGYQDLMVLDHGRGLFTIYGHLEALQFAKGDLVEKGAVLGKSAYQPVENAHHLYFEVRLNGRAENPANWLRPGSYKQAGQG